ncbi:MAG: hypothetical protein N4J56_006479 [Chroococcidiopsis sp. SAG 2025]|uniref:hypothetical protein n=1 Tax=Chroococcidiopsis sp. SAG 2025 TaxID=171389 RepID=UPI00293735C2|nr:hypothetical protein [Chroococcidiopsis sp. SAG 2025]MDV2996774.1 hypothetical protein [Chroococcidiopsis sp. SAG 2025]
MKFLNLNKVFTSALAVPILLSLFTLPSSVVGEANASSIDTSATYEKQNRGETELDVQSAEGELDGNWIITWRTRDNRGIWTYYRGSLNLENDEGIMTVQVKKNDRVIRTVKERMAVSPGNEEGQYTLTATSVNPKKNYTPDEFELEDNGNGGWTIRHTASPGARNVRIVASN